MNFTNPNDVFVDIPMDNTGLNQFISTVTFVNQVDLGERTVSFNGARVKVKRLGLDYKITRQFGTTTSTNPLVNSNLLDKRNLNQLRTQALVGGLLNYSTGNGGRISGVKVGGDNFHRHFNDDGLGNAGYGSGFNIVSRPGNRVSCLSDKLLELTDPITTTNLPYLQAGEVWPSTNVDTTPYPASISSRIGNHLQLKMSSSTIPGKELSELTFHTEMNTINLDIDSFPRLDINPNKNFGPFDYRYIIANWHPSNSRITYLAIGRQRPTTEKIDYGTFHRIVLGNYNESTAETDGVHMLHNQLVSIYQAGDNTGLCYPCCENFNVSNAHFRIVYDRASKQYPNYQVGDVGYGLNTFRANIYNPNSYSLALGSTYEDGNYLPRYMCLWAIEGDNNYVEIDLEDDNFIFVHNEDASVTRYVSLVGIRGTGNVVVIRLKRSLRFYGNQKIYNGGVVFSTMTSNNPYRNVVYILGPKNQNISGSILFNDATIRDPMSRILNGCIHMDLEFTVSSLQKGGPFNSYGKYYANNP